MGSPFYRMQKPDYESDYKHSYINGELDHPYSLPGVKCSVCGATWGGSRILASSCPEELRHHKNLLSSWPISNSDHAKLQEKIMAALRMQGEPFIDLRPGDAFQPCYLDIPSRPAADFLWPCLGSLVVSERIRDLFLEVCPTDIAVCPVSLRKVGTRDPNLPPPMPSTREPEDIIREVPFLDDLRSVGEYSEILVLKNSNFPPDDMPTSSCSACKRRQFAGNRELRMTPEMWNGQAIFFMSTTLHVIVTDHLKRGIEQLCPTNVVFDPV